MLIYDNIIGNQEDWANMITNVEAESLPFMSWLMSGEKPVNTVKSYQAEIYADPVVNSHPDGTPVTNFLSAGDDRGELVARVQYATKASAVSKLHQDVSDIAGVNDELARDIIKRTYELSGDLEASFLGNDEGRADSGTVGSLTRGVSTWVQTAAQTIDIVPSAFRPGADQCITTATASINQDAFIDVFRAMGTIRKGSDPITAFVAPKAKMAMNKMPYFTPASTLIGGTPTGATGVVYQQGSVNTGGVVMERYGTDFGTVELRLSWRNRQFDTPSTGVPRNYTTFFLHRDMWQLAWNTKPTWQRKAYQGGAYEAFCEAIYMLICKNPKAEGKWAPTA